MALFYGRPSVGAGAVAGWLIMLLVHELGHDLAAARRGCRTEFIELFPFHGHCHYLPNRPEDQYFVAWGGVIAQVILAIPVFAYVRFFGFTQFAFVNAGFVVLAIFNPLTALINLIPVSPLDGVLAWRLFPILWNRRRRPKAQHDLSPREALQKAMGVPEKKG